MNKKQQKVNPSKALSKNSGKSRDRNTFSYKQLPQTQDITQLSFLEKRLDQQIKLRQQGYEQLLQMIRILDQTKKSKVPANFQKLSQKKLLSPVRLPTIESEDINLIKAQIAEIHSLKQLDEQQSKSKIQQIDRQIRGIKIKFEQIQGVKVNFLHLNQQLNHFKQQVLQAHHIVKLQLQQLSNSTILEGLHQKFNNHYMLTKTLSTDLIKMQTNFNTIENYVKSLGIALKSIQSNVQSQFSVIEQKVQKAAKNIYQTKSSLQEVFYGNGKSDKNGSRFQSDPLQKINNYQIRMEGLQRRMDFIYHQYLSIPVKHKI